MTTKIQKKQLQKAISEKIALVGSQNDVAKQLGISSGHVFNLKNGNFDKISDDLTRKLIQKLNIGANWNIAEIDSFQMIAGICYNAQKNSTRQMIIGKWGYGKSCSLKHYSLNNRNVYYIECEEYFRKKVFLQELCDVLGINQLGLNSSEMIRLIIGFLNKKENALLIVDEAGELDDQTFKLMKTFSNKTSAGIIIAGTPSLKKKIENRIQRDKETFGELFSRFGGEYLVVPKMNKKSVKQICEANGVTDEADINMVCNEADGDYRIVRRAINELRLDTNFTN